MKGKMFLAAFLVICVLSSCAKKEAPKEDANKVSAKEAGSQAVSSDVSALQTANSLAKYGYENYSAAALIEAAEILAKVQTQALDIERKAAEPAADTGTKTAKPEFTPENLLADAKQFASGDATLLAFADKVAASTQTKTRGAANGPKYGVFKLPGGRYDEFPAVFRANERAEIGVSGDGDTDLDLYIYDSNGNLIVYDEDPSDDCYVTWVPKWTGEFTVRVVNLGRVYNQYVLTSN
ncbi:hypothetical protein FACS189485_05410 [Spirochaetia bacterium]|nr:hypothetical protein FACS189485_05410 [Spirochaetia bacterium]